MPITARTNNTVLGCFIDMLACPLYFGTAVLTLNARQLHLGPAGIPMYRESKRVRENENNTFTGMNFSV